MNLRMSKHLLGNSLTWLLCNIISLMFIAEASSQLQLKLVTVVFRHGDRTPDLNEMFPNDANSAKDFYPATPGELINGGKRRLYELGNLLRNRYNDFLGNLYLPNSIKARSTDYDRTRMSLNLVLAALYPPEGQNLWNKKLNWQPIPINYARAWEDWLMVPEECPEYLIERKRAERIPKIAAEIESFRPFIKDLTQWTGKNISQPVDMFNLYHLLVAESSMNLSLPQWTKDIFPYGKLYEGTLLEYKIFSYTSMMRRLNGGKLLRDILKQMQKFKNRTVDKDVKISIYSGHETNVAALLQTLGIFKPHVPEYTSAVILELYERKAKYYVKVYYYLGIPAKIVMQQIPGCARLCTLDEFSRLLLNVTPRSDEMFCEILKA